MNCAHCNAALKNTDSKCSVCGRPVASAPLLHSIIGDIGMLKGDVTVNVYGSSNHGANTHPYPQKDSFASAETNHSLVSPIKQLRLQILHSSQIDLRINQLLLCKDINTLFVAASTGLYALSAKNFLNQCDPIPVNWGGISSLDIDLDAKILMVGCSNGSLRLIHYQVEPFALKEICHESHDGSQARVEKVCFVGNRFFVSQNTSSVRVWKAESNTITLYSERKEVNRIFSIDTSPFGDVVFICSRHQNPEYRNEAQLTAWNISNSSISRSSVISCEEINPDISSKEDGNVFVLTQSNTFKLWNTRGRLINDWTDTTHTRNPSQTHELVIRRSKDHKTHLTFDYTTIYLYGESTTNFSTLNMADEDRSVKRTEIIGISNFDKDSFAVLTKETLVLNKKISFKLHYCTAN